MDIRALQYFLTIAREGSVSAAAEVLHMTQPPLSRQLKMLEDELHTQLFSGIKINCFLRLKVNCCSSMRRTLSDSVSRPCRIC